MALSISPCRALAYAHITVQEKCPLVKVLAEAGHVENLWGNYWTDVF